MLHVWNRLRVMLVSGCALTALLAGPAAQVPGSPPAQDPEPVSTRSLEELVTTIEDPERRAQLLEQLRTLLAATDDEAVEENVAERSVESFSAFVRELMNEVAETAMRIYRQLARLPDALRDWWERMRVPAQRDAFVGEAGLLLAVLLAGWLSSLLIRLAVRRPRGALGARDAEAPRYEIPARLGRGALRLFLDLAAPLGAVAVVLGLVASLRPSGGVGVLAVAAAAAYGTERAIRAVLLVVLSPQAPEIRIAPLDSDHAARILGTLDRIVLLAVWGWFALDAARSLGAPADLLQPLRDLYALLLFLAAIGAILRIRGRLAAAEPEHLVQESAPPEAEVEAPVQPPPIIGPMPETPGPSVEGRGTSVFRSSLRVLARLWWIVALLYVSGLYVLWLSGIENGFGTALRATGISALWIGFGLVVLAVVRALLGRVREQLIESTRPYPDFERNVPRYVGLLHAAAHAVVWVTVLGFAVDAWGLHTLDLMDSSTMRSLITTALAVFLILLAALAVLDASTTIAASYLKRRQRQSKDSAKLRTLVPLANKTIRVVVTVMALLMVLSQLGVAIGPILASVSFVGLAVGFGAQSLVKDIISGTFNLLEDNVSVGDIVSLSGTGGVVETINIRTIQLRDLSGNLHTFPWGQVDTITNFTREYGRYLVECGVAYRENVDEVIGVLREIGAGMQADAGWRSKIVEPIEILGVDRFEDSAVVILARLKTAPAEQWGVGREFNRRMKNTFDERGIEIPFPHQTLYMGEDKQGKAPPLRLARAARAEEA